MANFHKLSLFLIETKRKPHLTLPITRNMPLFNIWYNFFKNFFFPLCYWMGQFKHYYHIYWKLQCFWKHYSQFPGPSPNSVYDWHNHKGIPDFRVSMAILNTIDISHRWCRLNFRPLWRHVQPCHFTERIHMRRQYFYFFKQISWNNWQEMVWTTLLDNDLGLLLPFKRN